MLVGKGYIQVPNGQVKGGGASFTREALVNSHRDIDITVSYQTSPRPQVSQEEQIRYEVIKTQSTEPDKVPSFQFNMLWLIFLGAFLIVVYNFFRKPPGLPPVSWLMLMTITSAWKHGLSGFQLYLELVKDTVEPTEELERNHLSISQRHGIPLGLIFSEGRPWQENRRFALRHLRDFGFGRSSLEKVIHPEVASLLKDLEGGAGRPTEVNWNLNVAVLNVIWRLVADRRYDINDPEIIHFEKMIRVNIDIIKGAAVLLDIFPWLLYLTPKFVLNSWMQMGQMEKNAEEFKQFVMSIIEEHEASLDTEKPRDYIDCYLLEMRERQGDPNTVFKQDYLDLLVSIGDLFAAGSETTSSTLRWVVLYMALHPDVQAKVQAELDGVVAEGALPSLTDRAKLPYTEATIMETLRMSSLIPRGIFHCNSDADVKIAGYNIPKTILKQHTKMQFNFKWDWEAITCIDRIASQNISNCGSLLVPDMEKCHRDPQYWEKPDQFYPEHFLDQDNQVITKKDGFLPFCVGRRQCLGESLARMELFLFTSALLKKFCITAPEGVKLSTETNKHRPAFNFAHPFQVIFTPRDDTLVEYVAASILRESICQCADAIKMATPVSRL
ncbi:cytochrome P450 2L1-like [Penaeus indicus]|uniref:cytochrome P450 2L1-like n=1 Tax=Penaeus indicus TaxID=29960 RepID=UPI00300D24C3